MKSIVNVNFLKAAANAASNDATRPYLHGVLVRFSTRAAIYVATDGYIMVVLRALLHNDHEDNTLLGDYIVPTEAIKALKANHAPYTIMEQVGAEGRFRIDNSFFTPINGSFPTWERVVPGTRWCPYKPWRPTEANPQPDQYAPQLLARIAKASKALGRSELLYIHYAENGMPAPISFGEDGFAVIMPTHSPARDWSPPAWVPSISTEAA